MRSIGYRQAWGYVEGEYDRAALSDKAIAATRQLGKRQLTWLRGLPGIETIEPDAARLARAITPA
jgi:tRNA dimethylallyltransferase